MMTLCICGADERVFLLQFTADSINNTSLSHTFNLSAEYTSFSIRLYTIIILNVKLAWIIYNMVDITWHTV